MGFAPAFRAIFDWKLSQEFDWNQDSATATANALGMKHDEFCINDDDSCIKNDVFCINDDDSCIKTDEFVI